MRFLQRITTLPTLASKIKTRVRERVTVRVRSLSSSIDEKQIREDHAYCVELVKKRDREGYLCGLLLPSSNNARKSYFALRAWNVELASVKDSISERRRLMGENHNTTNTNTNNNTNNNIALQMRMQWWKDALHTIIHQDNNTITTTESASPLLSSSVFYRNPVIRALSSGYKQHQWTPRFLERIVDARAADIFEAPSPIQLQQQQLQQQQQQQQLQQMPTLQNSIQYAEDSCSSLLYLALECVDVRDDAADEVASQIGIGWGLTIAIRGFTQRALWNSEWSIPADLISQHAIPLDYIIARQHNTEFQPDPKKEQLLQEAVHYMAHVASQHLQTASGLLDDNNNNNNIPSKARTALLAAVPAKHYLIKLKEANYDLFHPKLQPQAEQQSRLVLLAMLARGWWTGKF